MRFALCPVQIFVLSLLFMAMPALAEQTYALDIESQPLSSALKQFAEQSGLQVVYYTKVAAGRTASRVAGHLSASEALKQLLAGTNLTFEAIDERTVAIRAPASAYSLSTARGADRPSGESRDFDNANASSWLERSRLAQANQSKRDETTPSSEGRTQSSSSGSEERAFEEVVVTGTLIRGAQTASPLIVIDRVDIEQAGYSTVQEVVQSLPQNYGGGDNESTASFPGGSLLNMGLGSAANLRGLGSDSTLVLVNGHRLAPAGFGQFVDVSLIPLSVIERVEVVPDGVSATYGSDAVGGVINLVLKDHYDGAETLLKAGSTTSDDMDEYQVSQTLGGDWGWANALITYEYYQRGHLDANDRDFSENTVDPYHLLPEQERHSVFASGGVDIGEHGELTATALFSERQAERVLFDRFRGEPNLEPSETRQLSASLTGKIELANSWQSELTALYGRNHSDRDIVTPTQTRTGERNQYELDSVELNADGIAFEAHGGSARLAIGGSWRDERFEARTIAGLEGDRTVIAGFAELSLPLFDSLELSLAGRYEDYSDFGSTTNPKVGLVWSPVKVLSLRSTYGTSFRAPIFTELNDSNVNSVLINLANPTATDGQTLTMLVSGNSRELTPEEATTWTAGIDFEPTTMRGVELHATYFDTEFDNRIVEPLPGTAIFGIYNQADVYAPLITRNPDPAEVARLAALLFFFNLYGPFVPSDVEAIVDRRLQNISVTHVRGVDLSASSTLDTAAGRWTFRLDSTYLFEYTDQVTPAAPENKVVDTAYHPIDLRARAGVSWNRRRWAASGFVNYADGYVNNTVTPATDIDSWTTVDLQLAYDTGPAQLTGGGWLNDLRIALSAQNVFDEDPPFMTSPIVFFAIGFDPTNASPVGRFLSLTATKRW